MTEEERRQLDEDGYVILGRFMSDDLLERLRRRIDELFFEEGCRAGCEFKQEPGALRLANLVDKGEVFRDAIAMPEILERVEHVLGPEYKLGSLNARSTKPHSDDPQPLHVDMGALPDEKGYSVCNTIWVLDDFTPDNGATRVIPGSHRWGKRPQNELADPMAPHPDEKLVLAPAGSVVIMNAHCWHGGTANRTGAPRRAMHAFYCRRDLPQQQYQKRLLRPETQARLSARLRWLLALDDPLNDELSAPRLNTPGRDPSRSSVRRAAGAAALCGEVRESAAAIDTIASFMKNSLGAELAAEFIGTFVLIAFGAGVVAMVVLFGHNIPGEVVNGGYTNITIGWGLAVTMGVYIAGRISGAHLNPAVTLAVALFRGFPWRKVIPYTMVQVAGAFLGAAIVFWNYHPAFLKVDPALEHTAGVFTTFPAFPNAPSAGFLDQTIGTALLLLLIFAVTDERNQLPAGNLAPVIIGLIVVAIGMSFGGMHGYAINPARDFGPRLFTVLVGFRHNGLTDGTNDWWVPIAGPLLGGVIGAAAYDFGVRRFLPKA